MNNLYAPTFSSKKFLQYSDSAMTAEISDLLDGGFGYPFGRIYPDAADVGFKVRHENTGKISTWFLNEEFKNDGDITHWEFHPTPETIRKMPKLRGFKLTIFND